jgi:hypothetical protein
LKDFSIFPLDFNELFVKNRFFLKKVDKKWMKNPKGLKIKKKTFQLEGARLATL